MKKVYIILLTVFMLSISATTYAYANDNKHSKHHNNRYEHRNDNRPDRYHDWSNPYYHQDKWRHVEYHSGDLPFKWHERRNLFINHQNMVMINHREWNDRFPGLVSYRWRHDEGFFYHGHRINDAVLFYDNEDRLVSIGFKHDNVFIVIRDDNGSYHNDDSFFLSWSDQNFHLRITN